MPRDGAITFGDLIGRLGKLRIDCPKCGRSGTHRLARLIARYGRDEKLSRWIDEITADCPRKLARSDSDPCGAILPDLPKVGGPHPSSGPRKRSSFAIILPRALLWLDLAGHDAVTRYVGRLECRNPSALARAGRRRLKFNRNRRQARVHAERRVWCEEAPSHTPPNSSYRNRGARLDAIERQPRVSEPSGVSCRGQRQSVQYPSETPTRWAMTASHWCSWNGGCAAGRSRNRRAPQCVSVDNRRWRGDHTAGSTRSDRVGTDPLDPPNPQPSGTAPAGRTAKDPSRGVESPVCAPGWRLAGPAIFISGRSGSGRPFHPVCRTDLDLTSYH
jgi:hypothetical protein